MSGCAIVYITCRDAEEARALGRLLVERRLAACANVVPSIESCYWWEGRLVEDREALLLLKTTTARLPEVTAAVGEAHSYDVPAVLAIHASAGNEAYVRWVEGEVGR